MRLIIYSLVSFLVILLVVGSVNASKPKSRTHSKDIEYTEAALADQVTDLPGAEALELGFNHFAGYLTVDETAGRKMFYWFVESQNDPANDPVVLWTNGGPGCSGMIGMLTEQGPFRPQADGTVELNEYAWNLVANMMFIETPAGVGYSYSMTPTDYYDVGDDRVASDNYNGILQFLERYPHLVENDFYIASESYGGHYMPTLALEIVEGNLAGVNQEINFRGFSVGNPYTDPISNGIYGEFPTYWGHQLVSKGDWDTFEEHCYNNPDSGCVSAQETIYEKLGELDPYALDFPLCTSSTASRAAIRMHTAILRNRGVKARYSYEACEDDYATDYMQRDDVIAALHANDDLPFTWAECSSIMQYNYTWMDVYMEPIYLELLEKQPDIKMLVYSGDDDAVCATIGTQYWIYNLGRSVLKSWSPWYLDEELGGYIVHFDGLTFMTVHSAGHMVPATQPERALYIFSNYLAGTLPYYNQLTADYQATTIDHTLSDAFAPSPVDLPKEGTSTTLDGITDTTATTTTTTTTSATTTTSEGALSPKGEGKGAVSSVSPQQKLKRARHERSIAARSQVTTTPSQAELTQNKSPLRPRGTLESRREARRQAKLAHEAKRAAKLTKAKSAVKTASTTN